MRIRIISAFLLVMVLLFPLYAQESENWYQGKVISKIVFSGLRNIESSELQGITDPYIGSVFSDDVFFELQGKLYALEYFEVITPAIEPADLAGNEVTLKFTVTENPTVSRIVFSGNTNVRRTDLLEVISLKVDDIANQFKLRIDEEAIRNKYFEKGFPDVKVRSELQTGKNSTYAVTFYVDEGDKIIIGGFRFEGNVVFSERTLRGLLSLKAKGLFNDGAFQETKLMMDRIAIMQYYQERGYIDADVTDVQRDTQKDDKGNNVMTLTFKIYEGKQYTFSGVTFDGNQIFSTKQLSDLVYSKTGEIVNAQKLAADLQRVADLYFENGYINNLIGREEIRDTEKGTIGFRIPIVERGRAHIENIIIKGNDKTKKSVILREIPLEPGDIFSKTKVMNGWRDLYNLQYFSNIIPDTQQGSADGLMDLVFTVEEQPTIDLQFGITFSGTSDPDTFPISGLLKWNDRNFLGYGNSVGAELNLSPDTQSLSVEYTHRWIFGLPLSASFDLTAQHTRRLAAMDNLAPFFNGNEEFAYPDGFDSYEEYENASKVPPDAYLMTYDQWRISIGASTGYRFSTPLGNLAIGGGIRTGVVYNIYDADLFRPFDPAIRKSNNELTPANSIWASISLDQRDIYYDPSKGYYGSQRFGYYGVFDTEAEYYTRSDTKLEFFLTLFNWQITDTYAFKAVFGIHTGLSFLFPQPWREIAIENANKLAVDGMFTGRGWSEYHIKGLAMWENWAEIRIPLFPGILAWDFFFDIAGVHDTPQSFFENFPITDNLRFSYGGGIRFTIPQFPFRLSFAKRFKIVDGAVEWQRGAIGAQSSDPAWMGMDFVISFALSSY
jgi:outer membrane protein insertion porin family